MISLSSFEITIRLEILTRRSYHHVIIFCFEFQIQEKYNEQLEQEARLWIEQILGEELEAVSDIKTMIVSACPCFA